MIALCLQFHIKGGFSITLVFCSLVYWARFDAWPTAFVSSPQLEAMNPFDSPLTLDTLELMANLMFFHAVALNGVARAFSDLAGLTLPGGRTPRGRWLYVVTGLLNVLSGCFGGPMMGICPESGSGIKSGARTGLSTVFCGILFGISVFLTPMFMQVPYAGTAPLLFAIGMVLFANVQKIQWSDYQHAYPAFITLFFIPFTYSIVRGVIYGWIAYLILTLMTGELYHNTIDLIEHYKFQRPWR